MNRNFACIILAAGKGTRMNSDIPKVLHEIRGKSLISYVVSNALKAEYKPIIVVVGYEKEKVIDSLKNFNVDFAIQNEQHGTGHAVMCAEKGLENFDGDILILLGDMPFVSIETLRHMISIHLESNADMTIATATSDTNKDYGRIIRDNSNNISEIVEYKDATEEQRNIKEINPSIYLFKKEVLLDSLKKIQSHNSQGEYYLTDCIGILKNEGKNISSIVIKDEKEVAGINTQEQLKYAESLS